MKPPELFKTCTCGLDDKVEMHLCMGRKLSWWERQARKGVRAALGMEGGYHGVRALPAGVSGTREGVAPGWRLPPREGYLTQVLKVK